MSNNYYEQFRNNQRDANRNRTNPNSKSKLPRPRPTTVRQPPRSDTFVLQAKRQELDPKVSRTKPVWNSSGRIPPKPHVVKSPSPPPPRRRVEPVHRNGLARFSARYRSPPVDQLDLGRKPIRFAHSRNPAYHPSSPLPPIRQQKSAPLSHDVPNRSRRVRIANNDYIVERRRPPPPSEYSYDDRRTVSDRFFALLANSNFLFLNARSLTFPHTSFLAICDEEKKLKPHRSVFACEY